jgi:pyruvate,water dikinase
VVLAFDAAGVSLPVVGGKGANLARLATAGFEVPRGYLITTAGYRAFVAANDLQPFIVEAAGGAAPDDPAALEAASSAIRTRFAAGRMPSDLEQALRDAYARLGEPPVAVRSSATAEDLPEMSFAGQQDTYLNVVGSDALVEAIVRCWSSLWTARAIGYRARNGIAPDEVALAVVVQEMAPAEASGVLFTANPRNGRRAEVAIDAALGLGEALVSGQLEPDHYVVAADGRILEKTLGSKAVSVRTRPDGGTVTVAEEAAERQALPDAAIRELARLGRRIAELYGVPQDIEWAWEGDRFHVLQSRPITSLFPLPRDVAPEPLRVMLSFGAVQGMLDPITPLGRETLAALFAGGATLFGYDYTPETQPVLRVAAERLFIDLSPIARHPVGRRVLRRVLPLIEPGGEQALRPLWSDPRLGRRLPRSGATGLWRVIGVLLLILARLAYTLVRPDASRRELERRVEAFVSENRSRAEAASTLAERVALLEEVVRRVFPFLAPNFIPRLGSGMGALNALRLMCRDTPGAPAVLELTRGLPHNVTTEMDLTLWRTACAIERDARAAALFAVNDAETLAASYLAGGLPPAAQGAVGSFLERYGMRGVAEIDLGRPRWREDPTAIMQVLKSYLEIEEADEAPDASFARGAAAAEAAIESLAAAARAKRAGWLKSRAVRWVARRMRSLAGLRESPKFSVIRVFGFVREALLAGGRELAEAGVLARPDDLFFLRIAELKALAGGEARDWRATVAERREAYRREQQRRQIPRVLLSDGEAFFDGLRPADADGADLVGSPVSPGVVEGVVRVLLDPRGARLAPGEILVCPATDPGWTPLFLAAGGLVMEVGGLMTHGAVVAREYGIPAVVGVDGATHRLESGQRVRLDGSSGRIEVLPSGTS